MRVRTALAPRAFSVSGVQGSPNLRLLGGVAGRVGAQPNLRTRGAPGCVPGARTAGSVEVPGEVSEIPGYPTRVSHWDCQSPW